MDNLNEIKFIVSKEAKGFIGWTNTAHKLLHGLYLYIICHHYVVTTTFLALKRTMAVLR